QQARRRLADLPRIARLPDRRALRLPAALTLHPLQSATGNTTRHAASARGGAIVRAQETIGDISMLSIFRKLMKNQDGATAIESVLTASLISVAAITAMGHVGGKVSNVLSNVANAMT